MRATALGVALCALLPLRAEAGSWSIRPELETDVPILVGAGVLLESPGRVRLSTALGALPPAYVSLSNDIAQMFSPSYTEDMATLVENTLDTSLVWRIHLGWRPLPLFGFYAHTGYTLVALGGGASAKAFVESITGIDVGEATASDLTGALQLEAETTIHYIDVELGWDWKLWHRLMLRTGIGWSYGAASTEAVSASFEARAPGVQDNIDTLETEAGGFLHDALHSHVHPPSSSVAIGWRFGG